MILAALTAAILSLAPVGQARAVELAQGMAAAAGDDLEAGLELVVTASAESSFRRSVQTCAVTGDGGRAVTSYQLHRHHWGHHTSTELCADHALASRMARRALGGPGSVRLRFARFMGRRITDPEVTHRVMTFERLLAAARAQQGDT